MESIRRYVVHSMFRLRFFPVLLLVGLLTGSPAPVQATFCSINMPNPPTIEYQVRNNSQGELTVYLSDSECRESVLGRIAPRTVYAASGPEYSAIIVRNSRGDIVSQFTLLRSDPRLSSVNIRHMTPSTEGRITFDAAVWNGQAWSSRNIYIMNANGSELTNLTDSPAQNGNPVFSPNGTLIAFDSDRSGDREIYLMNADGSNLTRLTNNPGDDILPQFTPDGESLVFVRGSNTNAEIVQMNIRTGSVTPLTNNTVEDSNPAVSNSFQQVLFTRDENDNRDIYAILLNGADERRVIDSPQIDTSAVFAPDDVFVYFRSNREGGSDPEIYSQGARVNGAVVRQMTDNDAIDETPAPSPSGSQMMFTRRAGDASEFFIMEMNNGSSSGDRFLAATDFRLYSMDWYGPDQLSGQYLLNGGTGMTSGTPVNAGRMQIEGYCSEINAAYSAEHDGTNWYCTENGNRVSTLQPAEYNAICSRTYNRPGSYAEQVFTNQIEAFSWRCFYNFHTRPVTDFRLSQPVVSPNASNPAGTGDESSNPSDAGTDTNTGSSTQFDGAAVEFEWNSDSFYMYNPGDTFQVSGLRFESLNDNDNFAGTRWATFYSSIERNHCVEIEIVSGTNYINPDRCQGVNARVTPGATSPEVFWTDGSFRVLWEGTEIGRCETAAGSCTLRLP